MLMPTRFFVLSSAKINRTQKHPYFDYSFKFFSSRSLSLSLYFAGTNKKKEEEERASGIKEESERVTC